MLFPRRIRKVLTQCPIEFCSKCKKYKFLFQKQFCKVFFFQTRAIEFWQACHYCFLFQSPKFLCSKYEKFQEFVAFSQNVFLELLRKIYGPISWLRWSLKLTLIHNTKVHFSYQGLSRKPISWEGRRLMSGHVEPENSLLNIFHF